MVLEGPLIHHLEVSKQSFVLAVLLFGKIQTRFCISCTTYHLERSKQGFVLAVKTIWGDPHKVLY